MMGKFYFPQLHFVNTTCSVIEKDFSSIWSLMIYTENTTEKHFWKESGQGISYFWMCLTTLWMKHTSTPATQWAVPVQVLWWGHHVAFHLDILIARNFQTENYFLTNAFCLYLYIISFISLNLLLYSYLINHNCAIKTRLLNLRCTITVSPTKMTNTVGGATLDYTKMTLV